MKSILCFHISYTKKVVKIATNAGGFYGKINDEIPTNTVGEILWIDFKIPCKLLLIHEILSKGELEFISFIMTKIGTLGFLRIMPCNCFSLRLLEHFVPFIRFQFVLQMTVSQETSGGLFVDVIDEIGRDPDLFGPPISLHFFTDRPVLVSQFVERLFDKFAVLIIGKYIPVNCSETHPPGIRLEMLRDGFRHGCDFLGRAAQL